jgi:hypothetical protein
MKTYIVVPLYKPALGDLSFWRSIALVHSGYNFLLVHDGPCILQSSTYPSIANFRTLFDWPRNIIIVNTTVQAGIPSSLNTAVDLAAKDGCSSDSLFIIFDQDTRFKHIISPSRLLSNSNRLAPSLFFPLNVCSNSFWRKIFSIHWVQYSGLGFNYLAYSQYGKFDELFPVNHGDIEYISRLSKSCLIQFFQITEWEHSASPQNSLVIFQYNIIVHKLGRALIALRSSFALLLSRRKYPHVSLLGALTLFLVDLARLILIPLRHLFRDNK